MELQKKGTPEQVKEFKDRLFNQFFIMHSGEAAPAPGATQQAPAAQQQQQTTPIKVTSQEQFNKLPSRTTFVAPDGSVRIKP